MGWSEDGVSFDVAVSTNVEPLNPLYPIAIPIEPDPEGGFAPAGWRIDPGSTPINDWRGGVTGENEWFAQYIGAIPMPAPYHAQSGVDLLYDFMNPVVGHRYQASAFIRGSTNRYQTTRLSMYLSTYNAAGATTASTVTVVYGNNMPDAQRHMLSGATLPIAAGTVRLTVRFSIDSPPSPLPRYENPWSGFVSHLTISDWDDPRRTGDVDLDWHPIKCDVQECTTRYGRSRFTERYDVASTQLRLRNVEGDYAYDPMHPFNWGPGRMVKVTASVPGEPTPLPVTFGVIQTIAHAMEPDGTAMVNIQAVDITSYLSQVTVPQLRFPIPGAPPNTDPGDAFKSGLRIGALLDYAGIPNNFRDIDTGQWGMQLINVNGSSLREEAGVTADTEGGALYADQTGRIIYNDRVSVATDPNTVEVQGIVTAFEHGLSIDLQPDEFPTAPDAPIICPRTIATEWATERVINQVIIANRGNVSRTFEEPESQREYGIRTFQRLDFVGVDNAARSEQRAEDIFDTSATADLRIVSLTFNPAADTYSFALRVFLNWALRVMYYNRWGDWGFSSVSKVQSVEHRITSTEWTTTLTVDQSSNYTLITLFGPGWDVERWDIAKWDEEFAAGTAFWSSGDEWSVGDTWG